MLPRTLITAALLAVASAAAAANDWPQWRGPNQDAVCTETGLLKNWPTSGPPKLWTATKLGTGHGTPSVADGKVFGMGNRDGKDGVWAVKETDGSPLWFTPIDEAKEVTNNNGPGCAPTYRDGKLYAVSNNGKLACLDAASGKAVWKADFVKDFGAGVPKWGFNESALVDGDKVVCAPGSDRAAVVALRADTGSVIWKTQTKVGGGSGYSTPVKATVAGVPMYVVLLGQTAGFVGVSPETGKVLWQYARDANGTADIPTPIARDNLVWTASGYPPAGGAALLRLAPSGKDAVAVEEVKLYKSSALLNHHGGMVLVGDHVYFGHGQNRGEPVCVEFKTGAIKWGPEKYPAGGSGSAAYLYADGLFYVRYQNHVMTLLQMDPSGLKVVSSFKPPEPTRQSAWAHPVIANGRLYIRDQDRLHCFNVKAETN